MKRAQLLRLFANLVVASAFGGCAFYGWPHWDLPGWPAFPHWSAWRYGRVPYAGHEPPPPPIESIPSSPGVGFVWVSGHWRWQNDNFQWVDGSWQMPPKGRHEWIPGRWDFDLHGWYYVNGRWQ